MPLCSQPQQIVIIMFFGVALEKTYDWFLRILEMVDVLKQVFAGGVNSGIFYYSAEGLIPRRLRR